MRDPMKASSVPRLVRFARLQASNRRVLAEAFVMLVAASVAIKLLPFRRTAALMQGTVPPRPSNPAQQDWAVGQCRWAVERCAELVPWRAVCFQRGLALQLMLRRRGIGSLLHYGVAQDEERGLRAHVWVEVADRIVMGGEEAVGFALLASFSVTTRA